jgi:hypothetical protein
VCTVALAGDGVELVRRERAEGVEGVGIPPARELFQKLRDHQVRLEGCAVARGATDADLEWLDASWLTPPDLARMAAEYDRVVSV